MKLHILIGISGSGKSTKAAQMLEENSRIVRLNRDDLKTCIAGSTIGYYSAPNLSQREGIVSRMFDSALTYCFSKGLEVIVDNTNLTKKYITKFIEMAPNDYQIAFHIFPCDVLESRGRVILRDGNINLDYLLVQKK